MDRLQFPETSFPCRWSLPLKNQDKKRDLYGSVGTLGHVIMSDSDPRHSYLEHLPQLQDHSERYISCRPTLPLSNNPTVRLPENDILEHLEKLYKNTDQFLCRMKEIHSRRKNCEKRKLLKHSGKSFIRKQNSVKNQFIDSENVSMKEENNVDRILKKLSLSEDKQKTSSIKHPVLPKNTHRQNKFNFFNKEKNFLSSSYKVLKNITEITNHNSSYAGGSLCLLPGNRGDRNSSEGLVLLSSSGEHHQDLSMTEAKLEDKLVLRQTCCTAWDARLSICELTSQFVQDKRFIAVRGQYSCKMLQVKDLTEKTNLDNVHLEKVEVFTLKEKNTWPTAISFSPYIAGESLVSVSSGDVWLWNPVDGIHEKLVSHKAQRFYCEDKWRRSIFASHPRQIIVADVTTVELFDIRRQNASGVDIFALPTPLLSAIERVRMVRQLDYFHFVIACDHSIHILDSRFPLHPVLSWQHMLINAPQYVEVVSTGSPGETLVAIGCQKPAEIHCYLLNRENKMPFQLKGSPWKISKMGDFTKSVDSGYGCEVPFLEDRFNISLLGMAFWQHQDQLYAIQMDSYGDLHYQGYQYGGEFCDTTHSAGLGASDIQLDAWTQQEGQLWLLNFGEQVYEEIHKRDLDSVYLHKKSSISIDSPPVPSAQCAFCNPNMPRMAPQPPDHETAGKCNNCLMGTPDSYEIAYFSQEEVLHIPSACGEPNLREFDPNDLLSLTLSELWKDENADIPTILANRENIMKTSEDSSATNASSHDRSSQSQQDPSFLPSFHSPSKRDKSHTRSLTTSLGDLDTDPMTSTVAHSTDLTDCMARWTISQTSDEDSLPIRVEDLLEDSVDNTHLNISDQDKMDDDAFFSHQEKDNWITFSQSFGF